MTPMPEHTPSESTSQSDFHALLREKLMLAIRMTLMTILEEELTAVVGAERYQRSERRQDQRNGHYVRDLTTSFGTIEELVVPRTRRGHQTQLFERYHRRQSELDLAIGEMFVAGASQVQVGHIVEKLVGEQPSPSTVSRVYHSLESEFSAWKSRPLESRYLYAFADGTYFNVIYDGQGHKMPILAVMGINTKGERDVLAFTVGERENQAAWCDMLDQLKQRGMQTVDLWITDGNQAMLNALSAKFPDSTRQRCVQHKIQHVLGYIPKSQQPNVSPELKAIFYQESRQAAEQHVAAFVLKFERLYPSAVACLQRNLDATLAFYAFPPEHWKTIRTTNLLERLFEEVKKRSHKMASAFRNENSCLLLFFAVIRGLQFKRIPVTPVSPSSNLHNT